MRMSYKRIYRADQPPINKGLCSSRAAVLRSKALLEETSQVVKDLQDGAYLRDTSRSASALTTA